MKVFLHHIYEYKKGVRNLILHTISQKFEIKVCQILERNGISYTIQEVNSEKINVLFGDEICVNVFKKFNKTSLSELTDEEDFILGIMLGYDRRKQCERYLSRIDKSNQLHIVA